jgi:hypothetical protein
VKAASQLDAIVAAFVGVMALLVSAYTAHIQKQQVRAQVLPILEYGTSSGPIHADVTNKGVGPALVRHVIVRLDGEPIHDWDEAMTRFAWPGKHNYSESNIGGHVLAPNDKLEIFKPLTDDYQDVGRLDGELGKRANVDRFRIAVEICYCSTLGDCWTLRAGGDEGASTTEAGRCPARSDVTFLQ